jgi:hypothetical protein
MVTSAVVELKPVTDSLKVTEQLKLVLFVGVVLGVQVKAVTVGALVSIVYDRVEDAVELLPAVSVTAPAAIWIVSVPSVLGAPRLTVNV